MKDEPIDWSTKGGQFISNIPSAMIIDKLQRPPFPDAI
jgi:hypothetical protein